MGAPLPLATSISLYRTLYLARRCEEVIVRIYPDDEMKTPMHMSMGQEAVSVGVCRGLDGKGDIMASYRSHAAYLAQTEDHAAFFGELHGRTNGTADGKSGSMHLSDIPKGMLGATGIVAGGIAIAVGAAFANKHNAPERTAVAFFGDGATDEGAFWESLNVACAMKLPIIFVCEDNDLAVYTRKSTRQGFKSIADVVSQYNCLVYEDDSNDVETIYHLTRTAAAQIRAGGMPAFMNIKTYRYLEHCGTAEDTSAPYRRADEEAFWRARDCVALQRNRLLEKGVAEKDIAAIESEINDAVESSVAAAKAAPHPAREKLYHGVFYEAGVA
jgi:TPP-dependent pyruvate/acetoin dehydrogenase alpha subunit